MTSGKRKNDSSRQERKRELITKEEIESILEDPERLGELDKEQLMLVVQEANSFSGPLPPPAILKGYEDAFPGSAERILRMAEKQSAHRQEAERKMISTESRDSLLGVVFAFVLSLCALVVAVVMVIKVPTAAGAVSGSFIGATGMGSIVLTFIKGTRISRGDSKKQSE